MVLDASSLVFDIHGRMLRTLCEVSDKHYQGLAAAANDGYREGLITRRMQRRMISVDHAFQVIRHISTVTVRTDSDELDAIIRKHKGDDGEKTTPPNQVYTTIGVKMENTGDSAQAGDSCNTEKRRRHDSTVPPPSSDGCALPSKAKDDCTPASTEVITTKLDDMELLIQKFRRESNRKYEDYRQTIDSVAVRCGRLERVIADTKEEIMLEVKALEVISGVIRAEKAKEGSDTHRRLEFLEQSCSDILQHSVQLARDSRGCIHSLRESFAELKRP